MPSQRIPQTIKITGNPVMSQENQALLRGGAILAFSQIARMIPPEWIPRGTQRPDMGPVQKPAKQVAKSPAV